MLWEKFRKSTNVSDLRKNKAAKVGGLAAVAAAVIAAVGYIVPLPQSVMEYYTETDQIVSARFDHQTHAEFVKAVLGSNEDVWRGLFANAKLNWQDAKLVLFTDGVRSACGTTGSDFGPFYCPADGGIYIDLDFFNIMERNLRSPGDSVQAYVIAHEMGHHVQTLMGTLPDTYSKMQRVRNQTEANQFLVRLELQADCYAGIWFNHVKFALEPGDLAEIINAASKIGDDYIQSLSGKGIMPDSFQHGTGAQRAAWLVQGFKNGTIESCETFNILDSEVGLNSPTMSSVNQ